ncbi:LamG-like jellyroll fold domain-containing protein [Corynebacterium sp. NML 120412]|uniref:LamG-like jellyroll fold domain-containing protein n=1 Tax=Corynebacterium sp. NML 120412 TaxID=2029401 RepID=UPI001E6470FA|nr:LamG-like jellyroll fold domain-containing protein [Corynebacterium sp. NML 120412]
MRTHIAAVTALALLTPMTQLPLPTANAAEAGAEAGADLASRFTLGVLPDTQFYARYGDKDAGDIFGTRYGSNPFDVQTEFLAKHHEDLNTQFVAHLGDVVDQANVRNSWDISSEAMKPLEDAHLNYSILPGNHDYFMFDGEDGPSAFEEYFPEERAKQNATFQARHQSTGIHDGGDGYGFPGQKTDSEYHIFEAEGQQYLLLALGFRAPDDTLDWAQQVIDEHPDLPVILTAHEISGIGGDGSTYFTKEYGEHLWDKLIRKNDQIFLTIAGHHHGAGYHVKKNDAGHDVINILQDYQMAYLGGNGLMGQLQFDLTNNTLDMTAYSPWVKDKEHAKLTSFDHLLPEGEGDSYSIDLNFAERFKSFAPDFTKGDENDPDYAELLRTTVADGFQPYEVTEQDKPRNDQDYVHVDGTAVHWRPGQTTFEGKVLNDASPAPKGAVIPDVANGNDMTRVRYRVGAREDAVTFSEDTHPLSSDRGSLRWKDPKFKHSTAWFETATGADINDMQFENGYTMEAFLKLDEDWNADNNKWSNALIRDESGTVAHPDSEDGDPIQMLGVSSLRELRWYAWGQNGEGFSNWTHEVPKGEWMHVAVVNDPKDKSVTMYVDGSPILRDGYGPLGMGGEGAQWLLGTSAWENDKVDGWFGNIGEVRIVDHPIGPDQWLTARAADAPTPSPTTTAPSATTTAAATTAAATTAAATTSPTAPAATETTTVTTTVTAPNTEPTTAATTAPTTAPTTAAPAPATATATATETVTVTETASPSEGSSTAESAGLFAGGILIGLLTLFGALVFDLGGVINSIVDQIRSALNI